MEETVDVADHVHVLLNRRIFLLNIRIFVSALINIRIFLPGLLNIRILLLNIRIFSHPEFGLFSVQEGVDVADHVLALPNIRLFAPEYVYLGSKNTDIKKNTYVWFETTCVQAPGVRPFRRGERRRRSGPRACATATTRREREIRERETERERGERKRSEREREGGGKKGQPRISVRV